MGTALFDRLASDANVSEIVDSRIYPELSPEKRSGEYPRIVYHYDSSGSTTYGGQLARLYSVVIMAIARTVMEAELLGETVIAALHNADWMTAADEYTTVDVLQSLYQGETLDVITVDDAKETRLSMKSLSFELIVTL